MGSRSHKIENIVVLTGAGISAESGIPVFRSETGLWENHRVEDVCTPEAFDRNPGLVMSFYDRMRVNLKNVKPNPAHVALARLEKEWKGGFTLVTQNIDNLHEQAGSEHVIHMHGELLKLRCYENYGGCGTVVETDQPQDPEAICPNCGKKLLRPHIVWFGEMPLDMDLISARLGESDLFISIGTSGVVYPAAGFVRSAKYAGAVTVEFNLEPSATKGYFDAGVYGKAGTTLPKFVDELLSRGSDYISELVSSGA